MSVASLVSARLPMLRGDVIVRRSGDVDVLRCPPARLRALALFLRDDADVACDQLVDVTVVDRGPDAEGGRFAAVALLASRTHATRVRLEVPLDDDEPAYPSLAVVWPAARLAERELWEMFGVTPDGHPGLRRLLLPDDVGGHPGRLDFRPAPQAGPTPGVGVVVEPAVPDRTNGPAGRGPR